ncbi:MAG: sialidase family protein [Thermoanaerobaculia bacterium]
MRFPGAVSRFLATAALAAVAGCAPDGVPSPQAGAHHHTVAEEPPCEETSIDCGNTPSLTFDRSGRLWAVFEQEGHAYVTRSDDRGASFSPPVRVNAEAEEIETNGEGRPKLALGPRGEVYISWTRSTGRFSGDIRFSRSLDGGASFTPPVTVNDDGKDTGNRFDSLWVDAAGDVYLAWIDKRDRDAAERAGRKYRGVSVYYTVSIDRGASFVPNRRVAHNACECCRIGITDAPGGGAAILWRHVFAPNVRDHAFTLLDREDAGELQRVSHEGWAIDACPHHGPALAPASVDGYHMTWFTAADGRPRIYYGRWDPESGETRHRREIAGGAQASHPHIARTGDLLVVVWKEVGSPRTSVYSIVSTDGGETWSDRRSLATTEGASDHPFLLGYGGDTYLAWHTGSEGLRMVPVPHEG